MGFSFILTAKSTCKGTAVKINERNPIRGHMLTFVSLTWFTFGYYMEKLDDEGKTCEGNPACVIFLRIEKWV